MFIRGFRELETSYVAAQVVLLLILLSVLVFMALKRMRIER